MGGDEIVIEISIEGQYMGDMCLNVKDIKNVLIRIQERYPQVRTNPKIKRIKQVLENTVRSQLNEDVKRYCYTQAGWNVYRGQRIYVHKGIALRDCIVNTEQNLPYINIADRNELVSIWKKMFFLYRVKDISLVLSLFTVSGVLYRLFEEAGYPIRTVLYIIGKTGSFKTALSKILFTQLSEDDYRGTPRRIDFDTGASLERTLISEGTDTVTFFDDVSPAKTRTAHSAIQNNLELILRMAGDGSTKSRSNGKLENVRGEGIHGTVVVTGEVMANGLSSNLRCLYLCIKKDMVNIEKVTWLQKNAFAVCTFILHFTDFVSENWEQILTKIATEFPGYRNDVLGNLASSRLIDCYAQLNLMADIVKEFLLNYCMATSELIGGLFEDQQHSILSAVLNSERLTEESEPADIFIDAFLSILEERGFFIINRKDLADNQDADGFIDEGFLYMREQRCYLKVVDWIAKGRISFPFNLKQTERFLCEAEYIVTSPNGENKITYCARVLIGKSKKNFLKFRGDMLRDFCVARRDGSAYADEWER